MHFTCITNKKTLYEQDGPRSYVHWLGLPDCDPFSVQSLTNLEQIGPFGPLFCVGPLELL
jgi:hypothetical protein